MRNKTLRTSRKQKEEHRQKLRNAIDLYHISAAFYPSDPYSKASKSNAPWVPTKANANDEKTALDDRIVQDVLSPVYMKLQTGGQYSTTFFSTPATLIAQAERLSQEARTLGSTAASGSSAPASPDVAAGLFSSLDTFSTSSSDKSTNVAYDPYATGELSVARVDEATLRHVRDLAKQLAAQRSTGAPQRGAPDAKVFDVASLNEREGRVRDALFGTVRGTLPGLETLRARILKRQKEEREAYRRARKERKEQEA